MSSGNHPQDPPQVPEQRRVGDGTTLPTSIEHDRHGRMRVVVEMSDELKRVIDGFSRDVDIALSGRAYEVFDALVNRGLAVEGWGIVGTRDGDPPSLTGTYLRKREQAERHADELNRFTEVGHYVVARILVLLPSAPEPTEPTTTTEPA